MSELSHQGAIRLIYRRHINESERQGLQSHLRDCAACRQDAEMAFYLSRHLALKQIPTRPSPQLAATYLESAARRYRRSQIMKPLYALGGAVALALVMLLGWYATRTDVPLIQAEQPTRPAVAAMPTLLAEALQEKTEPLQDGVAAAPNSALQKLIAAIKAGDEAEVSALLVGGAYFDDMDDAGHVLLPLAAKEGQLAIVQLLLEAGADVNSTMDGRTPNGDPYTGASALLHAAAWGNLDIVELLLAHGADPNKAETSFGDVPLHYAATFNYVDIVRTLLANGAAVDVRRQGDGTTPFHWAMINNSIEAAAALIEGGADVNLVEEQAGLPSLILLFSSTQTHVNDAIRLLLDAGADVNSASEWGTTPLMYAITSTAPGRTERVGWLLEAGADPDAQDMGGNTALHLAAKWGYVDVAELLIAHGAALDIQNIEDKTALDVAYKDEIKDMLRDAGAGESWSIFRS